ncbi:hypothetical protein KEM48_010717 [Puccinia striiformis f. sp. tritici PST-130]|uniref:Uncharacterized protein n=1 Tax=Puccinia striiformis f. sp. tritici PST-78 TaxID=1165861 RepID=A0A0L0VXE9_9BASI|nr:hypothetical protein KEM48_010717 [Puccinia striiformis f. sp. tritici PST-130]KNF03943.1 hypothetical protein PSTG_03029 [Puccinia striiformis f. sp. tritici PST-78]
MYVLRFYYTLQFRDGDPSGALSASGSAMPCAAHGPAVPDGSAFIQLPTDMDESLLGQVHLWVLTALLS